MKIFARNLSSQNSTTQRTPDMNPEGLCPCLE